MFNEDELIQYPTNIVDTIVNKVTNNNNITFTITTCKRFDLFQKTMNSFLHCCEDIHLIDRWICIDDNSSLEDRTKMLSLYPFFEFYFKCKSKKGHSSSMNIIQDIVTSPYILHLEDDWLFIKKMKYIQPALDILNSKDFNYIDKEAKLIMENGKLQPCEKIAQVLFNKNYTEDLNSIVYGGYRMETTEELRHTFVLHQYHPGEDNPLRYKANCAYWPYFSFRPSIFKREIFDKLGKYNTVGFFEMEYAHKFYDYGYVSCFYNKISSIHIGKKTWETDVKNAYDLNEVDQCVEKNVASTNNVNDININHTEIICLNLERRPDRKEVMKQQFDNLGLEYTFFNAVDGKNVKPTQDIIELFKNNDFGSKVGFIGCALSHKILWENLLAEQEKDYYIILEDDATLHSNFKTYLKQTLTELGSMNNQWDVLFMGYLLFDDKKMLYNPINQTDNIEINIKQLDKMNFVGGTHGYIISKHGAKKILDYIKENGIKHGIDYLMKICNTLNSYQLNRFIVYAEWVQYIDSSNVDTDIQKDHNFVDIYSDDNFKYIRGVDIMNHDICRLDNKSIDEIKKYALMNNNCYGFNTLGFMKSKINMNALQSSPYFFNIDDGFYVKRSLLNKQENVVEKSIQYKSEFTRIKLICNWCSSKDLCDQWNHMSKGNYIWNKIQVTWEDTDIDFFVIINKPLSNDDYYIPERTIIFHMEPWCYYDYQAWGVKTWGEWATPDENKFLQVRSHKNFINNCMWQLETSYTDFMKNTIVKKAEYNNIISCINSSKYFDPGQIKRIDFLRFIEFKDDPDVKLHIYGSNLDYKSYIETIPDTDKDRGILPYKYYFMCENNAEHNYITEKLWEPILAECLVFYWGCPNIADYIHPLAYVQLDMDDFEGSFTIIKYVINNNLWEQRLPFIRKEKERILNYYNFFPTLERILFEDFKISAHPDDEEIRAKKPNICNRKTTLLLLSKTVQ